MRADHAVELAGQPDRRQDRAGACGGLHDGAEAERVSRRSARCCSPKCSTKLRVPAGVFNLVNGDGPGVGAAIAAHPDIDMVSFTGSTRAGILVAKAAAPRRQARGAGTRRQVGEYPARRREPRRSRDARCRGLFYELRAVVFDSGRACWCPVI